MTDLPYFFELAEARLEGISPRDKTINIKVSVNTAQMMVDREKTILFEVLEELLGALKTYRESHNTCIKDSPQGLCNKCRIAEWAIAKAEGKEP